MASRAESAACTFCPALQFASGIKAPTAPLHAATGAVMRPNAYPGMGQIKSALGMELAIPAIQNRHTT
jgi:hypothetical protein